MANIKIISNAVSEGFSLNNEKTRTHTGTCTLNIWRCSISGDYNRNYNMWSDTRAMWHCWVFNRGNTETRELFFMSVSTSLGEFNSREAKEVPGSLAQLGLVSPTDKLPFYNHNKAFMRWKLLWVLVCHQRREQAPRSTISFQLDSSGHNRDKDIVAITMCSQTQWAQHQTWPAWVFSTKNPKCGIQHLCSTEEITGNPQVSLPSLTKIITWTN